MIEQQPLLPLEIWRSMLGFDPWHFWGWTDNSLLQVTSSCTPIVTEYEWQQTDAAGRVQIAEALIEAENMLFEYLGYEVAPKFKEATLPWPRRLDRRMMRTGPWDADGRWLNVQLPDGLIQAVGTRTLTLIQANVPVVYTDSDNDTYPDLATIGPIVIPTTITDISEIAIYVSVADRFGDDTAVGDRWEITPLRATISGTSLTIKAGGWMFSRPILREGYGKAILDPTTAANFVTTVDVYRKYTDPTQTDVLLAQAEIIWETTPLHGWWCQCSSCGSDPFMGSPDDPAAIARAAARVGIRNSRTGQVTPAETVFNTSTGIFATLDWGLCLEPDRVTIRYRAGYPYERGRIARKWQQIVARLAAAELNRPIVGCEDANRQLFYWQQDLSRTGASKEFFQTSAKVTDNRFGTRRGHVYAWNEVMDQRLIGGTLIF